MRTDGKFMVGDEVPEGQGAITQLLNECFDMAYQLRIDAETDEKEDADGEPPEADVLEIKSTA